MGRRESLKVIEARIGTLSNPSKMPGYGTSIPVSMCGIGSKLRLVPGSVCSECYAYRGHYPRGRTQRAMLKRFKALTLPSWVDDMAELINRKCAKVPWFRWYDSGDVQNRAHLERICAVATLTPGVNHWLPTREYKIVDDYQSNGGIIPSNLLVRLSAHMIDGPAPEGYGLCTSRVETITTPDTGHACPAR